MKKLLTLCLAFAMIIATCAFVTSAFAGTAANAEEIGSQTKSELTVKAKEAYVYSTETPDEHSALTDNPRSGTMQTLKTSLGMALFSDALKSNYKIYFKLETAVDASEYATMTFKAMYYANGSKYLPTTISNLDESSSAAVEIYGIQSKSVSPDILWVKLSTAAIKNAEGKIEGFILTAPEFTSEMYMSWFMISDFTFTKKVLIDYTDSDIRQDWFPIGLWKNENLRNAFYDISGPLRKTIKFASPISVNDVDYFDFKALNWLGGSNKWLPFNVYSIGKETANQNAIVFNEASEADLSVYEGKLDIRVAAKGLENENGLIEGFDIEITVPEHSHLVFSDILATTEELPLAEVDEIRTTVTGGLNEGFQTTNWANVPEWTENCVLYGGRNYDTKYTIALRYPVDSTKVKTIDFKAILWRADAAIKPVQISKLDGTPVEIINVYGGGWADVFDNDINVSVNAELLAEENGFVYGFKMEEVSEKSVAFQFSKFTSGAEAKTYTVTYKAEGSEDITKTFTAATKASYEAPAVPEKAHYTGAWATDEISFTEGQVINAVYTAIEYTATFKADGETVGTVKYTVENKDEVTAPAVPEKAHYTGAWENYTLNYDNEQVINAVYAAKQYSVTFKADGETVSTVNYTIENIDEVTAPAVPEKAHYTGEWNEYELAYSANQEVTAKYTAITYTITFKADGETVGTVSYTEETKGSITAPAVPEKSGYTGGWAEFVPEFYNAQVVEAQYTEITASDGGCVASMSGCGIAIAAIGMAVAVLKKKRV